MADRRRIKRIKLKIIGVEQYVQLLNGLFDLTPREKEVLCEFIILHFNLIKKGFIDVDVFSPRMKRKVAHRMKRNDPRFLNNYIKALKDKGAILQKDESTARYDFHPILIPFGKSEEIRIIIN